MSTRLALVSLVFATACGGDLLTQENEERACEHSPLVLDLDGDGILTSSPEDGVFFDLRQTGIPVQTAWPRGGDALLVMDRDGDGAITDGGELFGNAFESEGLRYQNGFRMLAELDRKELGGNRDNKIDQRDDAFFSLLLWRDKNRDGRSTPAELSTLEQASIVSIGLRSRPSSQRDVHGNRLALWGSFRFMDEEGEERDGTMVDVWFRFRRSALREPLAARADTLSGERSKFVPHHHGRGTSFQFHMESWKLTSSPW